MYKSWKLAQDQRGPSGSTKSPKPSKASTRSLGSSARFCPSRPNGRGGWRDRIRNRRSTPACSVTVILPLESDACTLCEVYNEKGWGPASSPPQIGGSERTLPPQLGVQWAMKESAREEVTHTHTHTHTHTRRNRPYTMYYIPTVLCFRPFFIKANTPSIFNFSLNFSL